jgi:hypothetical protein
MAEREEAIPSGKLMDAQKRYHRSGILFLIAGLLAAAVVYTHTTPKEYESGVSAFEMDGDHVSAVDPADLKRNSQDTWSKGNAHAAEFVDWAVSWWHGRRLAYTLAGLSVGGFLACLFLANFEFEVAPAKKNAGQSNGE